MKYFYSHLIEIESIVVKLDELKLSDTQKVHLTSLLDSTIHQVVLDIILSKLSDEDKKIFVEKMMGDPTDHKLMDFLSTKVENIEEEISQAVENLKEELHQDLQEASQKTGK